MNRAQSFRRRQVQTRIAALQVPAAPVQPLGPRPQSEEPARRLRLRDLAVFAEEATA